MPSNLSHDITDEFNLFENLVKSIVDPKSIEVILEIGSRDGLVSLKLKKAFPNAKIYTFECNPIAIEICRKNLKNHAGIFFEPYAITREDGPVKFFAIDAERTVTPHADGNIGASSLFKADPQYPFEIYVQNEIIVNGYRIDTWAKEHFIDKIDLVWMDVQGAELEVLEGFGELLKDVKIIYTELEYRSMYIGQSLAKEVRTFLRKNNLIFIKHMNGNEWFGNELFLNYKFASFKSRIKSFLKLLK